MMPLNPTVTIRELRGADDLAQVQALEKIVWHLADIDVLSLTWAIASIESGAIWLGAFDGPKLAGFAFAFPGIEHGTQNNGTISNGTINFHSHQLAVHPQYRDSDLGYRLKLAQREHVMGLRLGNAETRPADRIQEITWTFDPLQSKNAHLNFFKLGVISNSYKVDFYGPETSSALHRNSTDRLWVRWPITARRVGDRIAGKQPNLRTEALDALSTLHPLIEFRGDGHPLRANLQEALARQRIAIEIPSDINSVEQKTPELARAWRMETRWAFTESLRAGFYAKEFVRTVRGQQGPGTYLLEKATGYFPGA